MAEAAPMTFPLKAEIRGAPLAYYPELNQKIEQLLQKNVERYAPLANTIYNIQHSFALVVALLCGTLEFHQRRSGLSWVATKAVEASR